MNSIKKLLLLLLTGFIVQPVILMAAEDLTGVWESNDDTVQIIQDGSRLSHKQTDPDVAEILGEFEFLGEVSGDTVKGKSASTLKKEFKEFCGKNWAAWTELELVVSPDGNRLEGKWLRETNNTNVRGCPLISTAWEPKFYIRNRALTPTDEPAPNGKKTLIATLSLVGLALVFFFIRNAYVNYLVSSHKRSPNNAGLAGWGLFGGLLFGSSIGSVAIASSALLTIPVIGGLGALSLGCFVLCFVVSSKK